MHPPILAPSLLAASHINLAAGLEAVRAAGSRWLHLDIMDGHFVQNLSFGPQAVQELRRLDAELVFDVHLMLERPHEMVRAFAQAGANIITVHVEADHYVPSTLRMIQDLGCQRGLAINPGTTPERAIPYLRQVDMVLVMTVWPGFGGQELIAETLETVRALADWRQEKHLNYRIEVDGGVDLATRAACREAGADTFVAGSAFFRAADKQAFRAEFESP